MQSPYSQVFEPVTKTTGAVSTTGANAIAKLLSITVPAALPGDTTMAATISAVGLIKITLMGKIRGGVNNGLSVVGQALVTVKLLPNGTLSLPFSAFPISGDETAAGINPVGGLAPVTPTDNTVAFTVQNSSDAGETIDWVGQAELIMF